jgi:CRP/FNR family cyclic AMP-dependent transcriptional regulator
VETTQKTPKQSISGLDVSAFEEALATLPLATYRAGEPVLTAGSKSGRLLFLKSGTVVILKGSIEIARVKQPGAVFGEISALLDQAHTADVRTLEDSEFYVADAALLGKDPIAVLYIAKILAHRLVAADEGLVELRYRLHADEVLSGHRPVAADEGLVEPRADEALSELVATLDKALGAQPRFFGRDRAN